MKLYTYWRSSCSWRVRTVLALKGVAYESAPVHLVRNGGEQNGSEQVRLNPMRQVPTLEWQEGKDVFHLSQSLAICQFLDTRFPEPPLFPTDALGRARVWELSEMVNAGIQPLQNLTVLRTLEDRASKVDVAGWAMHWIDRGLSALETRAQVTAGEFLVGDAVSLADVCLVPQLYNARRYGLDPSLWPTLSRIDARCAELPAFQESHPNRQPDAPQEETT